MSKINAINNASGSLTIDPGASGDSALQFDINGTGEFRIGVDDDAADAFKISQGSALGSNDCFVIASTGETTKPLTTCFSAYAALQSNVTGDSTVYTLQYTGGEYFDQNNDFDGTSTLTAPVTGKYLLITNIEMSDLAAAHTGLVTICVTSNRSYGGELIDPGNVMDASNEYSTHMAVIADMDAADTAHFTLEVENSTKVVDVNATDTIFTGCLLV